MKQRREQLGISQGQLAEGICHQSMVSRVEKQNHITSVTVLKALCVRLHIDIKQIAEVTTENHVQLTTVRTLIDQLEYQKAYDLLNSASFNADLEELVMSEYYLLNALWHSGIGEATKALHYLQLALSTVLHTQVGLIIEIFSEMGAIWIKMAEYENAKDCLERCTKLYNAMKKDAKNDMVRAVMVKVYRYYAQLATQQKDYEQTLLWINQAMQVMPRLNTFYELVQLQELRIQAASALGKKQEQKEAKLLAYAAGLFSQEQKLAEQTQHYKIEFETNEVK
nr:helix-turn-helix transcriptional regulator [Weissella uvarum]